MGIKFKTSYGLVNFSYNQIEKEIFDFLVENQGCCCNDVVISFKYKLPKRIVYDVVTGNRNKLWTFQKTYASRRNIYISDEQKLKAMEIYDGLDVTRPEPKKDIRIDVIKALFGGITENQIDEIMKIATGGGK